MLWIWAAGAGGTTSSGEESSKLRASRPWAPLKDTMVFASDLQVPRPLQSRRIALLQGQLLLQEALEGIRQDVASGFAALEPERRGAHHGAIRIHHREARKAGPLSIAEHHVHRTRLRQQALQVLLPPTERCGLKEKAPRRMTSQARAE